jgi:hypothetical protein
MDRRNMDTIATPGYDADEDMAKGDDFFSSADECEESTHKRKCRPSPLMRVSCRRRKRRRREKRSKRPLISIAHPDIDSSLTNQIVARRQQQHQKPTASPEPPLSLHALSHLLEDYFQQQHTNYEAPAPVSDEDCATPEQVNSSKSSSGRGNCHSQARSSECMFLEDALGFSSDARILVEASPLHRVVHANAAFCSLAVEKEPSQKKASAIRRVQKRFRMPSNSFESVVSTMFADRPVTVYPVKDSDGSGVIRYYLVEHVVVATTEKRLAHYAEPAHTVG